MKELAIAITVTIFSIFLTAYVTIHVSRSSTKEEAIKSLSDLSKKTLIIVSMLLNLCAMYLLGSTLYQEIANLDSPIQKEALKIISWLVVTFSATFSILLFQIMSIVLLILVRIGREHVDLSRKQTELIHMVAELNHQKGKSSEKA